MFWTYRFTEHGQETWNQLPRAFQLSKSLVRRNRFPKHRFRLKSRLSATATQDRCMVYPRQTALAVSIKGHCQELGQIVLRALQGHRDYVHGLDISQNLSKKTIVWTFQKYVRSQRI